MNKILELYGELAGNKISKIKLKKFIGEGIQALDSASKFLKTVDPEKFTNAFVKHVGVAAEKAYDEGKISPETVESARRLTIISPGEISNGIYEFNKAMLELCKLVKEKKGSGENSP